jgi:hypothetical protein
MIRWNLGSKLFFPSRHLWIRPTKTNKDLLSSSTSQLYLEIGITDRGWQDLGDITAVSSQHQIQNEVKQGDCLLTMDWDGHAISTADELYHTVWDSISGTYDLHSPIDGQVKYLATKEGNIVSDDEDILAILSTSDKDFQTKWLDKFVSEREYDKLIRNEIGTFHRVDGLYR